MIIVYRPVEAYPTARMCSSIKEKQLKVVLEPLMIVAGDQRFMIWPVMMILHGSHV